MAKGFSPLIGLAVVVALAMVAVFGALSLNNATPVLAQDIGVQDETPTFDSGSKTPGSNTRYDLEFGTTTEVNTLTDELSIELADFGFPASAASTSVAIRVDDACSYCSYAPEDRNFTPENVTVDGEKLVITLGDMDTGDDVDYDYL